MTPEFRVVIKLGNNRLRRLREDLGLSTHEAAEQIGVNYGSYVALENLHESPQGKHGEWRALALKIAAHWGESPEHLWPLAILAVQRPVVVLEAEADKAGWLMAEQERRLLQAPAADQLVMDRDVIRRLLEYLMPRDREVIEALYLRDESHEEVGAAMTLTSERVRQLEARALRLMRHAAGGAVRCRDCRGAGKDPRGRKCRNCHGQGWVWKAGKLP